MSVERDRLTALALFLVSVLVYVPSFGAGVVFDDPVFVFENPLILAEDGLRRFWFTTEAPDYWPLTSSMLWVEHRLFGGDPTGYHVVNVLLHAASVVVLWRLLLRIGVRGALLGALLFALHPVNVESVTWITQRKNTLSMLLYLLAGWAWFGAADRARERGTVWVGGHWLSLALFALALVAKTSAVVLPAALVVVEWWRRRLSPRSLLPTVPFFLLALAAGLVTVWFQLESNIGTQVVRDDPLASRTALAGWAVWFYLAKALAPWGLSIVYPRWEADLGAWWTFLPLLGLVALGALLWLRRDSWGRAALAGLGYYVLALLPILGFVDNYFMRYSLVADHWQHTALLGPVALVGAGAVAWGERSRGARLPMHLVSGLVLVLLAGGTWRRQAVYESQETLWADAVEKGPTPIAHHNLALALRSRGEDEGAAAHLEACLVLAPEDPDALYELAGLRAAQGRREEAIRLYREAIRVEPGLPDAHNNLGTVLFLEGRHDEAAASYRRAIELDSGWTESHFNLGLALRASGRLREARASFERALALGLERARAEIDECDRLLRQRGAGR